jgi:predicted ribonuclease YlaK
MNYTGIREFICENDQQFVEIYERPEQFGFIINQYIIIKNSKGEIVDKRRFDGVELKHLSPAKIKEFKPKTVKQECLADLLSNKNIPIKIVCGVAGSGKTRMTIAHGLYFIQKQDYQKIFVMRHNVSVGEKNGYLPGDKFSKIRAWLGFFEDNISNTQLTIEDMYERGILDVDAVESLKGRDIKNAFLIIDECEDLTEEQFKMIGERVSEGSTICFVGDYDQTTNDKYKTSSGIKRAIEHLAGHPLVGIIVFDDKEKDNVRSETSKVFTSLY